MNPTPKATVYVETSVVSYLTARPSRDMVVAAHQEITRRWWEDARAHYMLLASEIVIEEARRGDPEAAARRLEVIEEIPLLSVTDEVVELAGLLLRELAIPSRAARDALHIAVASCHRVDFLLTWNCVHIAGLEVQRRLRGLGDQHGIHVPIIGTPEELMNE